MLESVSDEKREYWNKLIAEQAASGQGVRAFCEQRGVPDNSFYRWRKRLRNSEPVQFALLNTVSSGVPLELCLANGERLRIAKGVDAATLRLALDALRP